MQRVTGTYRESVAGEETVRAFIPHPLSPTRPPLRIEGELARLHADALAALGRLDVAGTMVPSADWFLYGFSRKEAVVSSQIEGTEAPCRTSSPMRPFGRPRILQTSRRSATTWRRSTTPVARYLTHTAFPSPSGCCARRTPG